MNLLTFVARHPAEIAWEGANHGPDIDGRGRN